MNVGWPLCVAFWVAGMIGLGWCSFLKIRITPGVARGFGVVNITRWLPSEERIYKLKDQDQEEARGVGEERGNHCRQGGVEK